MSTHQEDSEDEQSSGDVASGLDHNSNKKQQQVWIVQQVAGEAGGSGSFQGRMHGAGQEMCALAECLVAWSWGVGCLPYARQGLHLLPLFWWVM